MTFRMWAVAALVVLAAVVGRSAPHGSADRLYALIRSNDIKELRGELQAVSVDLRDERGATPLMDAAAIGSVEAMDVLLKAGADVNARNASGATALIWALGDRQKSRLLIEHGADVRAQSKFGRTPLLAIAGRPGNADLIRLLLDRGADPNERDGRGNTALMSAVQTGDTEMVRALIDNGARVDAVDMLGGTALVDAVTANWSDAAGALLAAHADPNASIKHHGTVRHGPVQIGKLSTLMAAATYGSPSLVQQLLKAGADVNAHDVRGMTPLMLASASENQDAAVVQAMIAAGADPNVKSDAGATALDWARRFGSPAVAAVLTRAGAEGAAVPTPAPELRTRPRYDAATALDRSLPLLERSSMKYFEESHCVGCHHQMATTIALGAARSAGVHVDEATAAELMKQMQNEFRVQREMNLEGGDREVLTRRLFELSRTGYPADASTDSAVVAVMSCQTADGSWRRSVPISRAPMQEGIIALTGEAVRAVAAYAPPAMQADTAELMTRARTWLLRARPRTTVDASVRLLGLSSSHASTGEVRDAARSLVGMQRRDGGWGGNPNLASDAFSTGEALYALRETGTAAVHDRVYRRAIDFLLRTQDESGAWHVRSRAVKVMPYFDSDFPFGDDQWISAAGTAMADVAIASTLKVHQPTGR